MMKKIIIAFISLTIVASTANAVTFHTEDKAFLEKVSVIGLTQANWDHGEFTSLMNNETQRISDYAIIYPGDNKRTFKKSKKSIDLSKIMVSDVDGQPLPLDILLRDRMLNSTMVVLKDGKIVHEHYWSGTNKDTKRFTQSAGKSFTSSLISIAQEEGSVKMTDPVEKYIPEAKGTVLGAYPIQYVADMRSGFALIDEGGYPIEGYDWDFSMAQSLSYNGHADVDSIGIADYTRKLTKLSYKQGKKFEYHSYNPELLGLITARVTGKNWAEYFEEKIWKAGQFTSPATIMVDRNKSPLTSGTLTMTTRDFANMGYIWGNDGKSQNGTQVIPKAWLDDVYAGNDEVRAAWKLGKEAPLADGFYKDQFRVLNLDGDEWLIAVGVQGQIVAVQKESKTVIAMFSNYSANSSPRMAALYFFTAIPAIQAAIK
ncbi:MAG: serine hydrolase domain-containing protein [Methanosarcinaceae archaeon]